MKIRFTIREILLAMIGMGAIIALVLQNWPPKEQTAFFRDFDGYEMVLTVAEENGIVVNSSKSGSSTVRAGVTRGRDGETRLRLQLASADKDLGVIMTQFRNAAERQLRDSGCRICTSSCTGDPMKNEVIAFKVIYRGYRTYGVMAARSFIGKNQQCLIYYLIHEN